MIALVATEEPSKGGSVLNEKELKKLEEDLEPILKNLDFHP